jgi:acyl-CoA synthetase (AMP-forming)/AMP-acid ligase II
VEVQTGRRWTYAGFAADVACLATGLLQAGIATGDRVGIWAPNVAEWTLVGVPDEKYGEELVAWIRVREGAEAPTAESLLLYCSGRIARFKIPRYVRVIDEFPTTVTGKVRKVDLRARAMESLAGPRDAARG